MRIDPGVTASQMRIDPGVTAALKAAKRGEKGRGGSCQRLAWLLLELGNDAADVEMVVRNAARRGETKSKLRATEKLARDAGVGD